MIMLMLQNGLMVSVILFSIFNAHVLTLRFHSIGAKKSFENLDKMLVKTCKSTVVC